MHYYRIDVICNHVWHIALFLFACSPSVGVRRRSSNDGLAHCSSNDGLALFAMGSPANSSPSSPQLLAPPSPVDAALKLTVAVDALFDKPAGLEVTSGVVLDSPSWDEDCFGALEPTTYFDFRPSEPPDADSTSEADVELPQREITEELSSQGSSISLHFGKIAAETPSTMSSSSGTVAAPHVDNFSDLDVFDDDIPEEHAVGDPVRKKLRLTHAEPIEPEDQAIMATPELQPEPEELAKPARGLVKGGLRVAAPPSIADLFFPSEPVAIDDLPSGNGVDDLPSGNGLGAEDIHIPRPTVPGDIEWWFDPVWNVVSNHLKCRSQKPMRRVRLEHVFAGCGEGVVGLGVLILYYWLCL